MQSNVPILFSCAFFFLLLAVFPCSQGPESNKRGVYVFGRKASEIWKSVFHNKENETAIDRNGDIGSFFPRTPCERLLEFT